MPTWVRLRKKRLNIDFGISAEEWDGEAEPGFDAPGLVRVTMYPGRVTILGPEDGGAVLRAIDEVIDEATRVGRTYEVREVKPSRRRRPGPGSSRSG